MRDEYNTDERSARWTRERADRLRAAARTAAEAILAHGDALADLPEAGDNGIEVDSA